MTSRKKRRSSLYARYRDRLVELLCSDVESLYGDIENIDESKFAGDLSANEIQEMVLKLVTKARDILQASGQLDGDARADFLFLMKTDRLKGRAPLPARILHVLDLFVALVYADGESMIERVGCLLPRRERDALVGDAIEAVRHQHSLSVGKPWPKFAVLATTAFWGGVIFKNAVLFAVFSHLPKRSR